MSWHSLHCQVYQSLSNGATGSTLMHDWSPSKRVHSTWNVALITLWYCRGLGFGHPLCLLPMFYGHVAMVQRLSLSSKCVKLSIRSVNWLKIGFWRHQWKQRGRTGLDGGLGWQWKKVPSCPLYIIPWLKLPDRFCYRSYRVNDE